MILGGQLVIAIFGDGRKGVQLTIDTSPWYLVRRRRLRIVGAADVRLEPVPAPVECLVPDKGDSTWYLVQVPR